MPSATCNKPLGNHQCEESLGCEVLDSDEEAVTPPRSCVKRSVHIAVFPQYLQGIVQCEHGLWLCALVPRA